MIPCEFGEGTRGPAGQVGDHAGDRHCFSAGSLIGRDGESAFEDGRQIAPSLSTRPCIVRRLVDETERLADRPADDLRCLAVGQRLAAGDHVFFAPVSGFRQRGNGDCGNVRGIDVGGSCRRRKPNRPRRR